MSEPDKWLKAYEFREGACEHSYNPHSGYCGLCRVKAERDRLTASNAALRAEVERLRADLKDTRDYFGESIREYRALVRSLVEYMEDIDGCSRASHHYEGNEREALIARAKAALGEDR